MGILTIYGGSNFGNKLQNYALQQFLRNEKIHSETIRYTISFDGKKLTKLEKLNLLKKKYFSHGTAEAIWNIRLIVGAKLHGKEIAEKKIERNRKFEEFERNNIALSDCIIKDTSELQAYCNKYDAVVVGSDQVWNPYWQGSLDEFFLDFVPENKRVAYAPSIGVLKIPVDQENRFLIKLNGFERLSCREIQGCKLIEKLTGRTCEHVCDPVFLLSPEQWKNKVKPISGKCVVTYFLGGESLKTHREIKRYAKKNNCKVVDLWSEKDYTSRFAGIDDFVNYIANAEMLFTDSFHGCAFAILLETQFVICERKMVDAKQKMNSRLDSLMEILDIPSRKLDDFIKNPAKIDYKDVYDRLLPWVQKSRKYLLDCLNEV